jgi:alpha 1,2-mannosyltransferase
MAPRIFASAGGYQTENGEDSHEFCGHTMLHWALTPSSEAHNPAYSPKPAFLHTILAKHRYHLQPEKLFTHVRKPRLDGITDPRLVRTYYEWTGQCFGITLKGPDGTMGVEGSWGDGQGVEMISMEELIGDNMVWRELQELSRTFVNIDH